MAKYEIELIDEQAKVFNEFLGSNLEMKLEQEISDGFPKEGEVRQRLIGLLIDFVSENTSKVPSPEVIAILPAMVHELAELLKY